MKQKLIYIFKGEPLMLFLVMILVPLLFMFIHNPRVAALFAGVLFLLVGVLTARQFFLTRDKILGLMSFLFLGLFVLPIFIIRILDWNANFQALSFLGIPLSWLHAYSKWVYIALWIASLKARLAQFNKSHLEQSR